MKLVDLLVKNGNGMRDMCIVWSFIYIISFWVQLFHSITVGNFLPPGFGCEKAHPSIVAGYSLSAAISSSRWLSPDLSNVSADICVFIHSANKM